MARVARIVIPGVPHHVTQRGNNRQAVFFVDGDRWTYLEFLREEADPAGLEVLAYCLMANYVHLVVIPAEEGSLARAIGRTHYRYTQYVNRRHGRSGHLWQSRYYSCALDDVCAVAALRYTERNPVRADLVGAPWEYRYSSAAAHVGGVERTGLLALGKWWAQWRPDGWREVLAEPDEQPGAAALRRATATGWPLGSEESIRGHEQALGRSLQPGPRGRPGKTGTVTLFHKAPRFGLSGKG